MKFIISNMAS